MTKEAALQAALTAHPGATAIGAPEAFPWDEDSVVWEVLLSSKDSKEVIVTVNATDGTIIESEVLDPAQPVDAVELNLDQPCQ
ncbi:MULTISPECIES: PepSY domain-containing protein [Actinomyces]|uniref:PepSY domain-containing protein n=1 Tax=Actinomyces TaxID=1654 RepID=UPI000981C7F0|nr:MULTISPECIES: PepSY domain-containing protein [Actinomyces]